MMNKVTNDKCWEFNPGLCVLLGSSPFSQSPSVAPLLLSATLEAADPLKQSQTIAGNGEEA